VNPDVLTDTLEETNRFISKARIALKKMKENPLAYMGCAETAACRRASMDLTRALAKLRKAN